jgi:hypothetical protein
MSNYTKTTNFTAKDSLPSGNPSKLVKGSDFDLEFNNIATAIASKEDVADLGPLAYQAIGAVSITGGSITGIDPLSDADGNVRSIPQSGSAKTTSYTLATTDNGNFIEVGSGGSIIVPDATFSAGQNVVIFNNTTGSITLTLNITTAYVSGVNTDRNSLSLATRGLATIFFISGTVCVVTGSVI